MGISKGSTVPQAAKKIGVSEQTYYSRRNKYGGLRLDQAKRMKALGNVTPMMSGLAGGK